MKKRFFVVYNIFNYEVLKAPKTVLVSDEDIARIGVQTTRVKDNDMNVETTATYITFDGNVYGNSLNMAAFDVPATPSGGAVTPISVNDGGSYVNKAGTLLEKIIMVFPDNVTQFNVGIGSAPDGDNISPTAPYYDRAVFSLDIFSTADAPIYFKGVNATVQIFIVTRAVR